MDSKAAIKSEAKLEPSVKPEANDENLPFSSIPVIPSAPGITDAPSVRVAPPIGTRTSIKPVGRVNKNPAHPGGVSKVKAPDTKRAQKIRETIERIQASRADDLDYLRMGKLDDSAAVTTGIVCYSCGFQGHRKYDEACMNYERDDTLRYMDIHEKFEYLEEQLFYTCYDLKRTAEDIQNLVMYLLEDKMSENNQTTE